MLNPNWQLNCTISGRTNLLCAVSISPAIFSYQVSVVSTAGWSQRLSSLGAVQRITRYPLLIRQILHYTQHGNDRVLIETSLLAAEATLEAINESIRDQEGSDRLKELSTRLWVGNGQLDLTAPTRFMGPRKLIKEGLVMKSNSKRRLRAVLCSDILVLVEESTGAIYRIVSSSFSVCLVTFLTCLA